MAHDREEKHSRGCCNKLKEEFRIKKLGLGYENPSLFVRPQCFSSKLYIPWTIIWALYYLTNLVAEIVFDMDLGAKYFTRVTHISLLLQSVFVVTDCVVTIYVHVRRPDIRRGEKTGMTWYTRMQWLMFNVTNSFSVLISLIYYTLLDVKFSYGSIYGHLTNSIYTFLGLLFSAKPVQLLHVYQPMVPAFLYMVFSIIHYVCGGDPIYPILDWGEKPGQTALIAVITIGVAIPLIHLICYILYCIRMFFGSKCNGTGENVLKQDESTYLKTF